MKKIFLIIVICLSLFIALSLTSCSNNKSNTKNQTQTTDNSADKTFTLDELAQYNGKNGKPAYVAVDGIVYDVTNIKEWKNGEHNGNTAGKDLTNAINSSPHGKSVLKDLPIVGKLK